jgi:outer membrane protein assembly factor BamE
MRSKIIFLSVMLAACGSNISHLSPYKMDIRQGNFVTPEMREKLKLGMTKQQVRYVLGTPLLSDVFHGERWDYAYSLVRGGKLIEKHGMTLEFDGENLARIHDGVLPDELASPVPISAVASSPTSQAVEIAALQAASAVAVPTPVIVAAAPEQAISLDETAVTASVQAWAVAWAARDLKRYFAAYSAAFKPVHLTSAAWHKQREHLIQKARNIVVDLQDMQVQFNDESHASVKFKQQYHSDVYADETRKTLQLEKVAGVWLIVAETVEP